MEFYGYHGVFAEENKLGQRFRVTAELELDLSKPGQTDNIDDTINYAKVYNLCKDIVEGKTYKLVEKVGEEIAAQILENYPPVRACTIKVIKPDPPIQGHYHSVAVQIRRER